MDVAGASDYGDPCALQQRSAVRNKLAAQVGRDRDRSGAGPPAVVALVGAVNASVIWLRFPSAHWIAAGFAATTSYALWGLADRRLALLRPRVDGPRLSRTLMHVARFTAGAAGWMAAIFAIGAFLNAALGGLSLPGR